jgi:hypothetical protein
VLLFGGITSVTSSARSDLWEWDGVNWVERTIATAPPRRFASSMAFDPVRGRALLVAGIAADSSLLRRHLTLSRNDW